MENPGLADDALLHILFRLPVESLLRFRCVSKSWNVLISSKYFAKMYLNRSLIDPKSLRLVWEDDFKLGGCRTHIFLADTSNLENSAHAIQPLHHPGLPDSTLIGSCNGLLCLLSPAFGRHEDYFVIVNPLTRRCSFSDGESGWYSTARSFHGFGYDDVQDDYKVVRWGVRLQKYCDESGGSKIEVYSAKNASWKTVILGLTDCYINGISCGILVNCTLHWITRNNEGRYCIVAFDLRIDEHRLMETPEDDLALPNPNDLGYHGYNCRMELGVLDGRLCGIVFDDYDPDKINLWVMKEYDIHDSWTKMTVDLSPDEFRGLRRLTVNNDKGRMTQIVPIVYLENKKQLILYSYAKGFLLCDMVTNKLSKVIKIPGLNQEKRMDFSYVAKEFCFQGSLVELPGFDSFDALLDEYMVAEQEQKRREEERKMIQSGEWWCGEISG